MGGEVILKCSSLTYSFLGANKFTSYPPNATFLQPVKSVMVPFL